MSFVVFNKETTVILRVFTRNQWRNADFYKTEGAAFAGLARHFKWTYATDGRDRFNPNDYDVLSHDEFKKIEKTETKINMMSGKPFTQSVNTPSYCDPSCESYWSA